jgi:hypothetical protein
MASSRQSAKVLVPNGIEARLSATSERGEIKIREA